MDAVQAWRDMQDQEKLKLHDRITELRMLAREAHDVLHKVLGMVSDRDAAHGEISELMRRIREKT